ncbi:MAG: pyruvate kinase [bacterium]|nr:pyruvate kinase [bacterium]
MEEMTTLFSGDLPGIEPETKLRKKTKVLCTIGPASNSYDILNKMVGSGMNAVRINTSHGEFDQYRHIIRTVRSIGNMPIIMDTQGPKIRLRMARELQIDVSDELTVGFTPQDEAFLDAQVYEYIQPGDRAMIDDGAFEASVVQKEDGHIRLRFKNSGFLPSGKAVNFPNRSLPLDPLTEKDVKSLAFAKEEGIDFIALSFARNRDDIKVCRRHLEGSSVKVIAKIENQEGIDNIDEIIEAADGVMVARGDMGVELQPEEVPMAQKRLIRACNRAGKLVITATQMLQSMMKNPRPTRAEISDVANAILDGSDVVMLSGETATGDYPVEAVAMMNRIALYSERFVQSSLSLGGAAEVERAICDSIKSLCEGAGVTKIVSVTRRGYTAKMIARLRLKQDVLALTSSEDAYRELQMYYGVTPVMYPNIAYSIRTLTAAMFLFNEGWVSAEDLVLFASAEYNPRDRRTNTLQILHMKDLKEYQENYERNDPCAKNDLS